MACESGNQTIDRHIAGLDVELTAGEPLAVVLGGALAVAPLSSWQVGAACLSLSPSEPATEIDAQLTEVADPEAPEDSLAATFTAEQTRLILGCELRVHLDGRLVVKGRFVAARPQHTPRGSASIEVTTSDAATAVIEVVQAVAVPAGGLVQSVNGQVGDVTLTASDVGADPEGTAAGLVAGLTPGDIGAAAAVHAASHEAGGSDEVTIGVGQIDATGTPGGSTYLRGDGAWAAPAGSTGVQVIDYTAEPPGTFTPDLSGLASSVQTVEFLLPDSSESIVDLTNLSNLPDPGGRGVLVVVGRRAEGQTVYLLTPSGYAFSNEAMPFAMAILVPTSEGWETKDWLVDALFAELLAMHDGLNVRATVAAWVWDGSDYVYANGQDSEFYQAARIFVGPVDPDPTWYPNPGDMWADTDGGTWNVWVDGAWVALGGGGGSTGVHVIDLSAEVPGTFTPDLSDIDPSVQTVEFVLPEGGHSTVDVSDSLRMPDPEGRGVLVVAGSGGEGFSHVLQTVSGTVTGTPGSGVPTVAVMAPTTSGWETRDAALDVAVAEVDAALSSITAAIAAIALADLADVDTTGATDGQALTFDADTDAWVPATITGLGTVSSINEIGPDGNGDVTLTASDVGAATTAQGSLADTAVQPDDLADVATSGAYGDLSGTPSLGTASAADTGDFASAAQGSTADTAVQPGDLATVATSGDYDDLTGKPTIPSTPADIGAATSAQGALADTAVQPGDLEAVATSGAYEDLTGTPSLATVATTGDYDDLDNRPTLGTAAAAATGDFATAAQGSTADTAVQPGDLATVALSGDYDDLSGTPTLGTAAAEDVEAFDLAGTAADEVAALPEVTAGPGIAVDTATPGLLGISTLASDVQDFTADGTWTKPEGATLVVALVISGGGGGASGRKGAEGTNRFGGGGGASGGSVLAILTASALDATEAVVVGAGGAGGAARTANNGNGSNGSNGGVSSFGPVSLGGGGGGWNGTATAGAAGTPSASSFIAASGGAASTSPIAGDNGGSGYAGGGGSGGTRVTGNTNSLAGGGGGAGSGAPGTTSGVGPGGQNGASGTDGLGGAGGAGGNVGVKGGDGGFPGGGGGGGGAGVDSTTDSGAGGTGGGGFVRVITLR